MTQKSITLELPDDLYHRIEEAAESTDRPMETVLLESLDLLFHAAHRELEADLTTCITPQLWAVVYRRLSDRLTLFRSQALVILKARGEDIDRYIYGA